MRSRRHPDAPRAETKALAATRARAASAFTAGSSYPPEDQVRLLKNLCRFLWGVLDRRAGVDGLPLVDDLWEELGVEERAAVDRCFDAALVLEARDRIFVEPCRRPLFGQWQGQGGFSFLLIYPDGQKRNIHEDELLAMAGLLQ